MNTPDSILGQLFRLFGGAIILTGFVLDALGIYILFFTEQPNIYGVSEGKVVEKIAFLGAWLVIYLLVGGLCLFVGNAIQKIWNIEFYLSHLAQNTYSVPVPKQTFQEKPISAPKEPNKPSNPQSDMSKYAPPK